MSDERIFATPRKEEDLADCYFYHTMELPGRGVIEGQDWDLRGRVDEYLGNVDFAGQRVLEIGPASGFLTFEMEKRGADVISVEVTDEHGWDFVPYPELQSRRLAIQSEGLLRRCLQFAGGAGRIRHRHHGSGAAPLPRSPSNRRAMRKKSKITHHRRQVPSRPGRRAGVSPCADAGEFPLAYVVAFQHAVFHPIPRSHGFHDVGIFKA